MPGPAPPFIDSTAPAQRRRAPELGRGWVSGPCGVVATLPSPSASALAVWTNCHHPAPPLLHSSVFRTYHTNLVSTEAPAPPSPFAMLHPPLTVPTLLQQAMQFPPPVAAVLLLCVWLRLSALSKLHRGCLEFLPGNFEFS